MNTLPPEIPFTDLELAFMEDEPPGFFPQNQDSYWGQLRRIITDQFQVVADLLATYYLNQSAATVNEDDMLEWERELGIPQNAGSRTLEQRRAFVLSRLAYGPFTRTRRKNIVEKFIIATFGTPVILTPDGVALDSGGVPFYSEVQDVTDTYNIVEDVENFTYDVRILNTVTVDEAGLQRELARITPGGITFTITSTATP